MKKLLPLFFVSAFSILHAEPSPSVWTSLSGIGDEIKLNQGQTAFVVSVSKPVYLAVKKKNHSSLSVRLRQAERKFFTSNTRSRAQGRRVTEVDWGNPFPISGPCTIRLGTSALATIRIVGP